MDQRLVDGYKKFAATTLQETSDLLDQLATKGQKPHTMVISCADSRVQVDQILGCDPGDLFVIRNVANLVPKIDGIVHHNSMSAALEFAVKALKISNIVVMGHTGCGGIASVVDNKVDDHEFIGLWMQSLRHWVEDHKTDFPIDPAARKTMLEKAAIHFSLENLKQYPFICDQIEAGSLTLTGLLFDIKTGDVSAVQSTGVGSYTLVSLKDL